jgi:branched-chain amino acid transport system permease protein
MTPHPKHTETGLGRPGLFRPIEVPSRPWQETPLLEQQLINGLTLGLIYALIAVGYTMVYGVIQLINFAHGEIYMLGAFFCVTFITMPSGLPFYAAILMAVICCALCGILLDIIAYRPLRKAPRLAALITAIGMSIFLQNVALIIWGSRSRPFPGGRAPIISKKRPWSWATSA